MGLLIAGVVVIMIMLIRGRQIFKHNIFVKRNTEAYKVTPQYINTDIPIEKALKDFSIVEINER